MTDCLSGWHPIAVYLWQGRRTHRGWESSLVVALLSLTSTVYPDSIFRHIGSVLPEARGWRLRGRARSRR